MNKYDSLKLPIYLTKREILKGEAAAPDRKGNILNRKRQRSDNHIAELHTTVTSDR